MQHNIPHGAANGSAPARPAYLDTTPSDDALAFRQDGVLTKNFNLDPLLLNRVAAETRAAGANGAHRIQDLWRRSDDVRALAAHPAVLQHLSALFGRRAFPFQTLNFVHGSQQKAHSDTFHFSSTPAHFMCGVWFALEDVDMENGPLFYYPGSHALPIATMQDIGGDDYVRDYEPFIERRLQAGGFEQQTALLKKGDAVIWAANLAHGGSPIGDRRRSRLSLVAHYYFDGCAYSTPMRGNARKPHIREVYDIAAGRFAAQSAMINGAHRRVRPALPVALAARYRYLMGKTIAF